MASTLTTAGAAPLDDRRPRHLPAPVQAWLDRCVEPGVEWPRRADLDTSGEIRVG